MRTDLVERLRIERAHIDGTDAYRKDTHTGQFSHFSSFEPFNRNTASGVARI